MLFEWLFERRRPGPVGTIEVSEPDGRDGAGALVRGLLALGLLIWFAWWVAREWPDAPDRFTAAVLTLLYLGIAYFLRVQPNFRNVGLWGTPIDHPLRFTDDLNRMLWFVQMLLWPGRFIAAGLADLVWVIRR